MGAGRLLSASTHRPRGIDDAAAVALTPEGLPRRRRKQVAADTEQGAEPPAPSPPVRKRPAEAGNRFDSFHTAVKQDRTRTTPSSEGTT
ncbi:hypothetical protein [Streptomyces sp. NPDC005336]|uniref:hypothetical protein n=1 Tax=Streptomyces sp. NPDC005336 TaxID=3157035 RepID=UPI0033AFC06A